jgi:pyrroline-5-carboxylate reductase
MQRIGIVGTGFMGFSLATAIRKGFSRAQFGVVEKYVPHRERALSALEARDFTNTPDKLGGWAEVVILAVKPQDLATVADGLRGTLGTTPVVSVLAGTSIPRIAEALATDRVIRIMPNLAAEIGRAVIGFSPATAVTAEVAAAVRELLSGAGLLVEVPEHLMATITAISGSGIAFVFEFIHAMAMGGVSEGLPYRQSLEASVEVVASAAEMLQTSEVHPEEMVSRVCSPGGTTIAGVRALGDGRFQATVMEAMARSAARSRELES